ncbi:hypothetical protein WR25_02282 [Diploscapter pachys]|uniref:Flavodoxin-like domain-containing protein n=1 Tax=Diploscapter pachys TaxID=2018661 RepID=A0A2A2JGY5_9BILA|nr:hypothetical protein WR25_02282 [Diploscapter pachys]
MSFHPPLRPDMGSKQTGPKPWYEEYLEGKDELLLYVTAVLGVILPGVVYFIYHKCHGCYLRYAKKKEEERLAEEAKKCEVAIMVLGKEDETAHKYAGILEERLGKEMVNSPKIWIAAKVDVKELMNFKGFGLFVVDTLEGGKPTKESDLLLEWLEDVAADAKAKKKSNFESIRFAVAGFGSSNDGESDFCKATRILLKRLKILGCKQMMEVELFDTEREEKENIEKFMDWMEELLDEMDKNVPGAEEFSSEEMSESEVETVEDKKNE